jgi:hypothetical protein
MITVTRYEVLFYSGEEGFREWRAQVVLYSETSLVGYIRFFVPGIDIPADDCLHGPIRMHMPSSMITPVLDMLRNERPIKLYFAGQRAFLGTYEEPVGEEES